MKTPTTPAASADQYPALKGVSKIALALVWRAWNEEGIPVTGVATPHGLTTAERKGLFYFTKHPSHIVAKIPGETGRYMLSRRGLAIASALDDSEWQARKPESMRVPA